MSVAFRVMVGAVAGHELIEARDEIATDVRICVLVDDDARGGVRREDVADAVHGAHIADCAGDALGDIEQLLIVAGADGDSFGQGGPPTSDYSASESWSKIGNVTFRVELEQEIDGRWIADIVELPGVLVYGATPKEATARARALARRVVTEQKDHRE